VRLKGTSTGSKVQIQYVDIERGSPYPAWRGHGSLQYPLPDQIRPIRASAEIDPLETHILDKDGRMLLQLPPEGTALIELV